MKKSPSQKMTKPQPTLPGKKPKTAKRPVKSDQLEKSDARSAPEKSTKLESIIAALQGRDGATLAELGSLIGWQAHSLRGMISTLRKKRHMDIIRLTRKDGQTAYRLESDVDAGAIGSKASVN